LSSWAQIREAHGEVEQRKRLRQTALFAVVRDVGTAFLDVRGQLQAVPVAHRNFVRIPGMLPTVNKHDRAAVPTTLADMTSEATAADLAQWYPPLSVAQRDEWVRLAQHEAARLQDLATKVPVESYLSALVEELDDAAVVMAS